MLFLQRGGDKTETEVNRITPHPFANALGYGQRIDLADGQAKDVQGQEGKWGNLMLSTLITDAVTARAVLSRRFV